MSTETESGNIASSTFIRMVISAWDTQNMRVTKLLETLSDEALAGATAPGRNSGHYLIGHLVAVSDALLPMLGFGERLYPELDPLFLDNPEQAGVDRPSLATLKQYWHTVNTELTAHIEKMPVAGWFTRHSKVTPEDFAREPHRNKLNVIINRTNHTSYHLGQLVYLVPKFNNTTDHT